MGTKKSRKVRFLREHPTCCFCGGGTSAETIDHIPSRQLFDGKVAPEGYEFPACYSCNQSTKHEEQVVALLSRIFPDDAHERQRAETANIMAAVARNYPEVLREMEPSARQRRNFLKKLGVERDPGTPLSEVPVLSVRGPRVDHCVRTFGAKLMLALHYKHTARILPGTGGVILKWFSNEQLLDGGLPESLSTVLAGLPKLKRNRTSLDDQFGYRFAHSPSGDVAAYAATFRLSFAIVGYVRVDSNFEGFKDERVHRPRVAA